MQKPCAFNDLVYDALWTIFLPDEGQVIKVLLLIRLLGSLEKDWGFDHEVEHLRKVLYSIHVLD